jgi:hypothetical protein
MGDGGFDEPFDSPRYDQDLDDVGGAKAEINVERKGPAGRPGGKIGQRHGNQIKRSMFAIGKDQRRGDNCVGGPEKRDFIDWGNQFNGENNG